MGAASSGHGLALEDGMVLNTSSPNLYTVIKGQKCRVSYRIFRLGGDNVGGVDTCKYKKVDDVKLEV